MVIVKKGRLAPAGAGWWHKRGTPDERISLCLNPGIVISWRDDEDCMVTLWRNDG